jgi:hypothetical protein
MKIYRQQRMCVFSDLKSVEVMGLNRLIDILNNGIVRTLVLICLCMILVMTQVFFPHLYFSTANRRSGDFEVGIHYVYEQDSTNQISTEVSRIHELGFSVIRVTLGYDPLNPESSRRTDAFYAATRSLGVDVSLIIPNHERSNTTRYYLNRWGENVAYIQILNEPDSSQSWDAGALFTDDEIMSKFEEAYRLAEPYRPGVKLYTNFGPGFVVRSNLPVTMSEKLDFVGLDVFMESYLILSPHFVELLRESTHKDVVITEFGMSTSDDAVQSDFIQRGLNLFKSMGLSGCWLTYWNSELDNYGIRGRLAERTVGEWIAQNT